MKSVPGSRSLNGAVPIRLSIVAAFDARVRAGEQVVTLPDCDTTQCSLGNQVVDRHPYLAVVDIQRPRPGHSECHPHIQVRNRHGGRQRGPADSRPDWKSAMTYFALLYPE